MNKAYDIVALGELLIDFTPLPDSPSGMKVFERNPGGAPANLLTAAARSGHRTAFLGKVGADMHGEYLAEVLGAVGISTEGLIIDESVFTTLAFVALDANGNRSFSFARRPGADTMLRADELRGELVEGCKVFHVGSLSLTDEPARAATFAAVQAARKAGAMISYDPNYRAPLWKSEQAAIEQMRSMLPFADLVKISDEETALLTGVQEPEEAAAALCKGGVSLVSVTLGAKGALLRSRSGAQVTVPAYDLPVVDTTGAGDTFWGSVLGELVRSGKAPDALDEADLRAFAQYGCAAAALCVGRRGGIPAIPTAEEIQTLLKQG